VPERKTMKKFDIVVGNPPYQKSTKEGGNGKRDLWDKFVPLCFKLCNETGFVCLIHPSKWRKPNHSFWNMLKNKLRYLYIASKKEGKKVFGVITRFDWYVASAKDVDVECAVSDELHNQHTLKLSSFPFLPNYNFEQLSHIIAKDNKEKCEVIYSSCFYDGRKQWMSEVKTDEHCFPCVYGMYKNNGIKLLYSKENKGHFGVSKVIVSCGEHPYPLIDVKGEYGMCNNAFAIKVESIQEAEGIKKALESEPFAELLKSTKWGNFQIEWKMFQYFRRDFWKDF